MTRNENEVQTMYRQSAKTGPQKALLARIDKLAETLDGMSYKGLSQADRARLLQAGKAAIATDLKNDMAAERERITGQLNHVEEKFTKEYTDNLNLNAFKLTSYERRFRAMDDVELRKLLTRYVSDETTLPNDPGIVDSLSAELRSRGFETEHAIARETARKNRYDEPWLQTPEGKLLNQELALNSPRADGVIPVEIDGKVAAFSVDALTEGI